jgi:hypothetical protein
VSTELATLARRTADAEFLQVFNRLCVGLRETQDDSGTTQMIYFEALRDLPIAALRGGADALMREPGRRFFPTTAEWRTAATQAHRELLRHAVAPAREQPWTVECEACEDTGWVLRACPGDAVCGRERAHGAHGYATVCPCRPHNRTYQRNQHFGKGAA